MPGGGLSNRAFGAGLAILAVLYVLVAAWQYSPALFGAYHDDTLYFSAAKALAQGEGRVLPNLPNSPAQTKYPPLYPLLLSSVWRIDPEFPGNLAWAWRLNLLFGLGLVFASVAVLRRLGCSRVEALGLGALFALNPYTILWTNLILSDVLFAALALAAVLAADRALERKGDSLWLWWVVAVVVACLAVATRTLGVSVLAGLFLFAVSKKQFLPAAVACLGALPTAFKLLNAQAAPAAASTGGISGFDQNWLYYTDYIDFWKLSVPNLDVFWAQVQFNGLELLKYPAVASFFFDAEGMTGMFTQAAAVAISAAIIHGIILRAKDHQYSSIHWIAICYVPLVLAWNFTLMARFWLAFVPLFLAGASFEVMRLGTAIRKVVREAKQTDQRIAGSLMGVAIAALLVNGAWRYVVTIPSGIHSIADQRAKSLEAKREAYAWLAGESAPGAVISYEDGLLYLYSGLQAIRPFSASTEPFFLQDEDAMKRDIARLGDTAAALNSHYWLSSSDDFELDYAKPQIATAAAELLETSRIVFESADGAVRVHELNAESTRAAK